MFYDPKYHIKRTTPCSKCNNFIFYKNKIHLCVTCHRDTLKKYARKGADNSKQPMNYESIEDRLARFNFKDKYCPATAWTNAMSSIKKLEII